MEKWIHPDLLDLIADAIAGSNLLVCCSAVPTDRDDAINNVGLAQASMTSDDFIKIDGAEGRRLKVRSKINIDVSFNGKCNHLALCDATRLLYVTPCDEVDLVVGTIVNSPEWYIRIDRPV